MVSLFWLVLEVKKGRNKRSSYKHFFFSKRHLKFSILKVPNKKTYQPISYVTNLFRLNLHIFTLDRVHRSSSRRRKGVSDSLASPVSLKSVWGWRILLVSVSLSNSPGHCQQDNSKLGSCWGNMIQSWYAEFQWGGLMYQQTHNMLRKATISYQGLIHS